MRRTLFVLSVLMTLTLGSGTASAQAVRDLNKLASRAAEYWKLVAAGERVKASSYIVAAKREGYLNNSGAPLLEPKLVGFQFTETVGRVMLRVSVKSIAGGIDTA